MPENLIYTDRDGTLLSDYEVAHWADYSNCGPETAELFFANDNESRKIEAAKRLCAACKVAQLCLQYAIDNDEKFGIWGGKTEQERGHKKARYDHEDLVVPKVQPSEDEVWHMRYDQLAPEVTANEITGLIGRKSTWIKEKGHELGVDPHPKFMQKTGRERNVYPKELAIMLREMILETPPADGWMTAYTVANAVGRKSPWVTLQLAAAGIEPEERRSTTNKILLHYPPSSVEFLQDILLNVMPPAGDWMTVGKIADAIGKEPSWVQLRINAKYVELGKLRRNDLNKPFIHYPPIVLELMRTQAAEEAKLPMAGDYLVMYTICALVGHTAKWVIPRLAFTGFVSEQRVNPITRQILDYYPPEIIEALLALPDDILPKATSEDNEGNSEVELLY